MNKYCVHYFCDSAFDWEQSDRFMIVDAKDEEDAKVKVENKVTTTYGRYVVTKVELASKELIERYGIDRET